MGGKRTFSRISAGKSGKRHGRSAVLKTALRIANGVVALILFGVFVLISSGYSDLNSVFRGVGQRRSANSSRVYYSGCAEARRAGVAPIYFWQPGYRSEMDRDGDGVACEPYRGSS